MLGSLLMIMVFMRAPARAGAQAPQFSADAQVISVSPVIVDQDVKAGSSDSFEMHIANQTSRQWTLRLSISGLAPRPGNSGDIDTSAAAAQQDASASSWLQPVTPVLRLAPGAERDVTIKVAVPENASPGGHYATVQVEPVPTTGSDVTISAHVTQLVLLSVDGAVRRDLHATITPVHRIAWSTPVHWRVRLSNGGNVHQLVVPTLRIDPLIGGRLRLTGRPIVVFPGQTRSLDMKAPVRSAPDRLSATLVLERQKSAGSPNGIQGTKQAAATLLLPLWFVIALLVMAGAISWRVLARRSRHSADDFVDVSGEDQ